MPDIYVSGQYIMWNVTRDPCIQFMSDAIVDHMVSSIAESSKRTVPDWVKGLPERERKAKREMIEKYGSPNVFSQFDPQYVFLFYCLFDL